MIFFEPQEFLKNCQNGRLLALDVGRVRIGVATTDDARKFSLPSDTIHRQGNKKDFPVIKKIIEEKKIKGIIVGLPISFEEKDTESSIFIKKFTENLAKEINLPICFQDERLTSFEAEDLMLDMIGSNRTKKVVDKISASYILEDFLNNIK